MFRIKKRLFKKYNLGNTTHQFIIVTLIKYINNHNDHKQTPEQDVHSFTVPSNICILNYLNKHQMYIVNSLAVKKIQYLHKLYETHSSDKINAITLYHYNLLM